ncbi:linear amide C-N hydrolase [Nodosilinea sp. P-1105]|uniref:linear amide C-N hydrolase n=1 Tax=Nodosilinea sp. P-1105 TaxID=2546229 RepID=UPI00146D63BA|nr:linear amide C-N hydrolase [Nodosilinea sp. P-1105]NMF85204.1 linear amide C-N hydrolase [Nodosilinea sp. P-1105]
MTFTIPFNPADIAALERFSNGPGFGCTSLTYLDANGNAYHGRTMELGQDFPYQLAYFPAGQTLKSVAGDAPALTYTTEYAMFVVTMPDRIPTAESPITPADLKVLEGINEAGLSFNLNAYPSVGGAQQQLDLTQAVLSVVDLGSWALGNFKTVAAVKAALAEQPVALTPLDILKGAAAPFHYLLSDRTGASIVVEFHEGTMTVYDNPVGVMTNGPRFDWHLTNLNNYTYLSNIDQSTNTFGSLQVHQPDSGIATVGLPSSSTSVGRFIRAVYYTQYTEKATDPDTAVLALSHIMNNFDRPKGVSIDPRTDGGGEGGVLAEGDTEYTPWTILADLNRARVFLRTYNGLNYTLFDLKQMAQTKAIKVMPLAQLEGLAPDGTATLLQ